MRAADWMERVHPVSWCLFGDEISRREGAIHPKYSADFCSQAATWHRRCQGAIDPPPLSTISINNVPLGKQSGLETFRDLLSFWLMLASARQYGTCTVLVVSANQVWSGFGSASRWVLSAQKGKIIWYKFGYLFGSYSVTPPAPSPK